MVREISFIVFYNSNSLDFVRGRYTRAGKCHNMHLKPLYNTFKCVTDSHGIISSSHDKMTPETELFYRVNKCAVLSEKRSLIVCVDRVGSASLSNAVSSGSVFIIYIRNNLPRQTV